MRFKYIADLRGEWNVEGQRQVLQWKQEGAGEKGGEMRGERSASDSWPTRFRRQPVDGNSSE